MKAHLAVLFLVAVLGCTVRVQTAYSESDDSINGLHIQINALQAQLSSLSVQVKFNTWERQVRHAQSVYNFHLDRLFDISCVANTSMDLVNAYLDDLMASFCPDVGSWTAATPDYINGTITKLDDTPPEAIGLDAIRAKYLAITTKPTFGCGSQHSVMNPVITFSFDAQNRPVASFTARLWQFALLGTKWADIMGFYDNQFTLENGRWCMSKFFAANDIIVKRPNDFDLFSFAEGSDQLPRLPRIQPAYV